tara:strand:+ start:472 stop:633 length:162 start_codon:yes stop_codon:yes gene_type:complete
MKRGLAHAASPATLGAMKFFRSILLVAILALGFMAPALAGEKKPSLIYYYFDG